MVDGIGARHDVLCARLGGEGQRRRVRGNGEVKGIGMCAGGEACEDLLGDGDDLGAGICGQHHGALRFGGAVIGEADGDLHRLACDGNRCVGHDRLELDREYRRRNRADRTCRSGNIARSVDGFEPIIISDAVGQSGIREAARSSLADAFERRRIGGRIGGTQDAGVINVSGRLREAESDAAAAHRVDRL